MNVATPITLRAVIDGVNVNSPSRWGSWDHHAIEVLLKGIGDYGFEGKIGLPVTTALDYPELCGAQVEVTIRVLTKGRKVVPWKATEVPLGCSIRERAKPETIWFVNRADQLNPDANVWSCSNGWSAAVLAAHYDYSTDGGETWAPAGRQTEEWS